MEFITNFIGPSLIHGLAYGIAAIGIALPLRFLRSADFTAIGSVMLGGVVAIWGTNKWGPAAGVCLGMLVPGCLGLITAWLSLRLSIPLMLAGIICFTASGSAGLYFARNGSIDLQQVGYFAATFDWNDALVVIGIVALICVLGGIFAKSKLGFFAFAMCATDRFVRFRHRRSAPTTRWLLFISNALVGLAGTLRAFKSKQAWVDPDPEFLSLTLGAIFAGDAAIRLVGHLLKRDLPEELQLDGQDAHTENRESVFGSVRLSLTAQRDDSERMWIVLSSYVVASVLLNALVHSIRGQSLPFHVSPVWEHLLVAVIITIGLLISRPRTSTTPA